MDEAACEISNRQIPQLSERSRLSTSGFDAFIPSRFYRGDDTGLLDDGCAVAEDIRAENNCRALSRAPKQPSVRIPLLM